LTRRNPDRATVHAAINELRQQAESASARVSVLAVAKRVGLANTTFRRRFPDLTEQITAGEYDDPRPPADSTASIKDTEAKLRQRNRDLQENLELAIAAIQRLTQDNQGLRQQLEAARVVTPIRPGQRAGAAGLSGDIHDW
jgi:AcrR family transcriptional regulator